MNSSSSTIIQTYGLNEANNNTLLIYLLSIIRKYAILFLVLQKTGRQDLSSTHIEHQMPLFYPGTENDNKLVYYDMMMIFAVNF